MSKTSKKLVVATEVQRAVLQNVLMQEISSGFFKNARPADHADSWKGVEFVVGTNLGADGFEVPRNYNFVNPDFFKKAEAKLLEAAQAIEPEITVKALKKQLISLNQIIGGRLTEVGGVVTKLPRGRKQSEPTEVKTTTTKTTKTRKAPANFTEPDSAQIETKVEQTAEEVAEA